MDQQTQTGRAGGPGILQHRFVRHLGRQYSTDQGMSNGSHPVLHGNGLPKPTPLQVNTTPPQQTNSGHVRLALFLAELQLWLNHPTNKL